MDWEAEFQRNQGIYNDVEPMDIAQDRPPSPDGTLPVFQEAPTEESTLEQLMRHWMNERYCHDILPAQEGLLGRILDHIRHQSDDVQRLRGDHSSSEEEHVRMNMVQTEVERVKFIVRSYVCTRLYKIEKYARFIASDAAIQSRLTTAEQAYALRHAKITETHLHLAVLQSLPPSQKALDDVPIFMPPMVNQPDKSKAVFARALEDCAPVKLLDGTFLEPRKGYVSAAPYWAVEDWILRGNVELV